MKRRLRTVLAAALLAALVPAPLATAVDSRLAVIVSPRLPTTILGREMLEAIYTGALRSWPDGSQVRMLNMPARSPERVRFDRVVLNMTPEQSSQFWIVKRIRGDGSPPRQMPNADVMRTVVNSLSGAIGYLPLSMVRQGDRVVARIDVREVLPP